MILKRKLIGIFGVILAMVVVGAYFNTQTPTDVIEVTEIREYEGKDLSSISALEKIQ